MVWATAPPGNLPGVHWVVLGAPRLSQTWQHSNTLATWCEELTHWKRPWCWERLKAAGKGDVRGWDGWMASQTQRTWVRVNSGSWWWTGKPGVLQSMGSQRVEHDWMTELNWLHSKREKYQKFIYPRTISIINDWGKHKRTERKRQQDDLFK